MHRNIDVESLKNSINIVDIINNYVKLQKCGTNTYKAKCPHPEHDDTNPSFYVKEDKQYFNCFSCGFKGDVISFIEEMEGIDFLEAVELLIESGDLNYEELKTSTTYIKDTFDLSKLQKAINLFNEEHTIDESRLDKYNYNHRYLLNRDYTKEILNYFEIGYCSDINDRLYNRVTIPWRDKKGRLVGINGRTVSNKKPKYLYSKDSNKNHVLYNIDKLEKSDEPIFLTEGELDTIRLTQLGYHRSLALGGSDLGDRKWLLREYTNHAILALDSDEAGLKARKKIIEQLYPLMDVSVLLVPKGKDIGDITDRKELIDLIKNKKKYRR